MPLRVSNRSHLVHGFFATPVTGLKDFLENDATLDGRLFPMRGYDIIEGYKAILTDNGLAEVTVSMSHVPKFDPELYFLDGREHGLTTTVISVVGTNNKFVESLYSDITGLFDGFELDVRPSYQKKLETSGKMLLDEFQPNVGRYNIHQNMLSTLSDRKEQPPKYLMNGAIPHIIAFTYGLTGYTYRNDLNDIHLVGYHTGMLHDLPVGVAMVYIQGQQIEPLMAIQGTLIFTQENDSCPSCNPDVCVPSRAFAGYVFSKDLLLAGGSVFQPGSLAGKAGDYCATIADFYDAKKPFSHIRHNLDALSEPSPYYWPLSPSALQDVKTLAKVAYDARL